jgi:hypothetical protein
MSSIFHRPANRPPTFLEEVWQFIQDKYFSVSFEEYHYENITLTENTFFSLSYIILAIFAGIIIAAAISLFQKRTLGDLVRALDRESCYTPESAKTLEELGFLKNTAVRESLRRGTSLRRVVRCVGEQKHLADQAEKRAAFEAEQEAKEKKSDRLPWKDIPYRYDFTVERFYIPEELAFGAITHFDKKGTNPLVFVFTVIACLILASLCCFLLPEMVKLADNFVSVFR